MKISFGHRGGWTGGLALGRPPAVLDGETLSSDERAELDRLVQAAFSRSTPPDDAARKAPGSFFITVEDGARLETLSVADMDEGLYPEASALRVWLAERMGK